MDEKAGLEQTAVTTPHFWTINPNTTDSAPWDSSNGGNDPFCDHDVNVKIQRPPPSYATHLTGHSTPANTSPSSSSSSTIICRSTNSSSSSSSSSSSNSSDSSTSTDDTYYPSCVSLGTEADLKKDLYCNSTSSSTLDEDTDSYPEGGREAWLVVLGCWCGMTASLGPMNTIASFHTYVTTHQLQEYSEGTIGWIFSVYTFLTFAAGIYVGPLFDLYGPRRMVCLGGCGLVLSFVLMSFATAYWHFLLTFGVLGGLSTSLLFTPCVASVGHYFRVRRGLATGIASTGGSCGGVIFPLLLESLYKTIGWAWAIRTLALICLVLVGLAMLLVRNRLPPAQNATTHPDLRIFGERAFLLTTIGVFLLEFGLFIPLAYISSYALANGFSAGFAFQILPILNAASVFGRVLPGYWADIVGPFNSNALSVLLSAIACLGVWLPAGHTMFGLVVFVLLFGFATGNNISITPVCVGRLCGTRHLGRYYATCYVVVSVSCLIGLPIAGTLVTALEGRYWGLIVLTGASELASLGFLVAAKGVSVGWKPWSKF